MLVEKASNMESQKRSLLSPQQVRPLHKAHVGDGNALGTHADMMQDFEDIHREVIGRRNSSLSNGMETGSGWYQLNRCRGTEDTKKPVDLASSDASTTSATPMQIWEHELFIDGVWHAIGQVEQK